MNKKIRDLIEDQINKEFYSAYLYFGIAEYYRAKGLDGFHTWFETQAKEELEHGEKFAEYLHDQQEKFELKAINQPNSDFNDFKEPLVLQLAHEKEVTASINKIYEEAVKVNDILTQHFLQWFILEQLEEEKNADDLITRYDLFASDSKVGLYQMNKDLSMRK